MKSLTVSGNRGNKFKKIKRVAQLDVTWLLLEEVWIWLWVPSWPKHKGKHHGLQAVVWRKNNFSKC